MSTKVTHGQQWLRAKLRRGRQPFLPVKREPNKHKDYYQMKIRTVQENTYEAWEAFRLYCKIKGYNPDVIGVNNAT